MRTWLQWTSQPQDGLEADCRAATIRGPPATIRGVATERVRDETNHYRVWKKAKAPSMVTGRTVTMYWESEMSPMYQRVKVQALKLSAVAPSAADLERVVRLLHGRARQCEPRAAPVREGQRAPARELRIHFLKFRLDGIN
jgi:hypothetical protein